MARNSDRHAGVARGTSACRSPVDGDNRPGWGRGDGRRMAGHPARDVPPVTCMTAFVEDDMPSISDCLTLQCPSYLISLVDTSFRAFLFHSYRSVNTETKHYRARDEAGTKRPPTSDALRLVVSNALRQIY